MTKIFLRLLYWLSPPQDPSIKDMTKGGLLVTARPKSPTDDKGIVLIDRSNGISEIQD